MNKIMSVVCLGVMVTAAANATPGYLYRTSNGTYKVVYDYTDKAKTGCNSGCCGSCAEPKADKSQAEISWYVGGRLGLSLLSWDNEYSTKPDIGADDDKESFAEAVFGGGVFLL